MISTIDDILANWSSSEEGGTLHHVISDLFPICRSITGNGLRQTLQYLSRMVPLKISEVPTGTQVFDWTIPKEWNVRDAWIKGPHGQKVADFSTNNLHLLNYSAPTHQRLGLAQLKEHLASIPEHPDWIPYRTSYFRERWGFCLSHRVIEALEEGEYEVMVDSDLEPGHLSYGEFLIKGESEAEVLISAHSCHPSLANDNLSGIAVAARLAQHLAPVNLRYSYRFLWAPGTIGAIAWLARNEETLGRIKHGLVLSCLGDPGRFTYKRSRRGNAEIDRLVVNVLRHKTRESEIRDFSPIGYDERQFCSPGINLPVGCFMRTPHGCYPEYHTSADNLSFVRPEALADSLRTLLEVIQFAEENLRYQSLFPKGEPQLGKRGLYRQTGGTKNARSEEAMLWVLNFADGTTSLIDVAERSGIPGGELITATRALMGAGLLRPVQGNN